MKTNFIKLTLAGTALMLGLSLLFVSARAQASTPFIADGEDVLIMKFQNIESSEKPQKVIVIFNDLSCVYELSDVSDIAFMQDSHSAVSGVKPSSVNKSTNLNEDEIEYLMDNILHEKTESEEALSLEEWMLNPAEWISN
ncbi:MAG: hypothetical protein JW894_06315 [Bacteroidales bacterium]|nr:hypothetical protein [Bacteroidales bacterium]